MKDLGYLGETRKKWQGWQKEGWQKHKKWQIFKWIFLLFCAQELLLASAPQFTWSKDLHLQKEQNYRAQIVLESTQKPLVLRWTLYKNYGLVMHIRYDKFNYQTILYTDYQRADFALPLGDNPKPMLHIFFKDFSEQKAHLRLYIEGVGASVAQENL